MPKLRMPVRYGSEIKDIEFTDFLELSDTAKLVISMPVGVKAPVKDSGIVSGKLLRCDNAGALLKSNQVSYSGFFTSDYSLDNDNAFVDIVFTKRVYFLRLLISYYNSFNYLYWTNSDHTVILKDLGRRSRIPIIFTGKAVSIGAAFTNDGEVDFDIWAYY